MSPAGRDAAWQAGLGIPRDERPASWLGVFFPGGFSCSAGLMPGEAERDGFVER
jgi:hypothetical protein